MTERREVREEGKQHATPRLAEPPRCQDLSCSSFRSLKFRRKMVPSAPARLPPRVVIWSEFFPG